MVWWLPFRQWKSNFWIIVKDFFCFTLSSHPHTRYSHLISKEEIILHLYSIFLLFWSPPRDDDMLYCGAMASPEFMWRSFSLKEVINFHFQLFLCTYFVHIRLRSQTTTYTRLRWCSLCNENETKKHERQWNYHWILLWTWFQCKNSN